MTVDEALQRARAIQQPPYTVLELAATVLAKEVEQLRAECEIAIWNLGGCNAYAMGYELDGEPAPELAAPALLDVLRLARREREQRADVDRLAAERDSLRALLREVEWSITWDGPPRDACPMCWGRKPSHHPDCRLAAALKTDAEG